MKDIYRQSHEYQEGRAAYRDGVRRAHNPYASGEKKGSAHAWWIGWDDEQEAYTGYKESNDGKQDN